jgi:putative oxidoreductase
MHKLNGALARLSPYATLVLRLVLGFIMFWHGKVKFFDTKITNVKGFFDAINVPVPGLTAPAVAVLELVGGLLIVFGVLTRFVSVLFVLELIGALLYYKYAKNVGLIGAKEAGAELDWALIAGFFTLAAYGAGRFAVDHVAGIDGRGRATT